MADLSQLFTFPDTVNETSARAVAGGVVAMAATAVIADKPWLMVPLTYGFAARVAAGPKLSPLGQFATRVVPRLIKVEHRYSPGAPKRLAQGFGLAMSSAAMILYFGFGRKRGAHEILGVLIGAAGLESAFGICLACKIFPFLAKAGIVPATACEDCTNIWSRPSPAVAPPAGAAGDAHNG